MAQDKHPSDRHEFLKGFFDFLFEHGFTEAEEKTWEKAPEAAYLMYYELLRQIHQTPLDFMEEINNGGALSKNEITLLPFEISIDEVLPSKNKEELYGAIEFLFAFDKKWHSMQNAQGDSIKAWQGLILEPHVGPDNVLVFLSVYRIKKLLQIPFSGEWFN